MESLTEVAGGIATGNGGEISKHKKNARPTAAQMKTREKQVLNLLRKNGTVDMYSIADALKLSHPQTGTLLGNLQKTGVVERAGREGRRLVYRVTPKVVPVDTVPVTAPVAVAAAPVQLGAHLEVIGIHITSSGVEVELQDEAQKTLTLVA
jgi:DNA-binding Lrp family transcriptional regulator